MNTTHYLKKLWMHAPLSWAIIRASECEVLSKQTFQPPILEVGCGDGLMTKTIFGEKDLCVDLGLDLDPEELRRAKISGLYKKLLKADICNTHLPSNSFNTVFSNGVLEHIIDLPQALREISRLLKKNGQLITTSPIDTYTELLFYYQLFTRLRFPRLAQAYGNYINTKFAHRHLLSLGEWKTLLKKAGLELIDFQYCNNPRTTIIHDLCLPFSLGSKYLKTKNDSLALFPNLRKLFQKLFTPLLFAYTKESKTKSNIYSTILLVARKK